MGKRKSRKKTEVHESGFGRQAVAVADPETESGPVECPRLRKPGCYLHYDGSEGSVNPLVKMVQRLIEADEWRVRQDKLLLGKEYAAERKYRFSEMRKRGKTPQQIRALAEARRDSRLIELCDEIIDGTRKESDLRYGVSNEVMARIKAKVQSDLY